MPHNSKVAWLEHHRNNNTICKIIKRTNQITTHNYFTYNNKQLKQQEGFPHSQYPIGDFLHKKEQYILYNNNTEHKFIYWHTYVDNMFMFYSINQRKLEKFHHCITEIHNNLKFTTELKTDEKINLSSSHKNTNQQHTQQR